MLKRLISLLPLVALALVVSPANAARLDPSFGSGGFIRAPDSPEFISFPSGVGHRVANYPGRRLVVGSSGSHGFSVRRYLAGGRLDRSFGNGGVAAVKLPGELGESREGAFASVTAIAVQPDGRILVGGIYSPFPPDNCDECEPEYEDPREYTALARLNPDGSRDKRFGRDGVQQVPHSGKKQIPSAAVSGLRFDPAGHIYLGGYDDGRFMLARLTRRGRVDRGFAEGGVVRTLLGGRCRCSWGEGLDRDRRGRLLVSGYAGTGTGGGAIAVARYRPGGRLDQTFGRHGFIRTRVGRTAYGYGVAVQPDGDIVVAGASSHASLYFDSFTVVRYRSDGRRDRGFFGDGIFNARFKKGSDRAVQPLIDSSGRLVVAGETFVARFQSIGRGRR
jgi:uncharacterized delta-60 repeat protein